MQYVKVGFVVFCVSILTMVFFSQSLRSQTQGDKQYMHFFVAPTVFTDGTTTAAAIVELKRFLVNLAGGYSELGVSEGGWLSPANDVETEMNIKFFVSATRDVSADIRQYLKDHLQQQYPYVIVWEALPEPDDETSHVSNWQENSKP
ncbi:MAG: hypothetical protein C4527_09155 [Candidatus Omnitrophota bacterium]|nr:MAG: hypothetical protein C4527_09155 [Candidatus Omnitrophota bacterium]